MACAAQFFDWFWRVVCRICVSTTAGEGGEGSSEEEELESEGGGGGGGGDAGEIEDETGTDVVNLRRTIYLTIMSSLDFEEAGHKLMKIQLRPGQVGGASLGFTTCICASSAGTALAVRIV